MRRLSTLIIPVVAGGLMGFNVTVPHKQRMAELVDTLEPQAELAGADAVPLVELELDYPAVGDYAPACLTFVVASATDLIDGWIARRYNQMSSFGEFLDPVADIGFGNQFGGQGSAHVTFPRGANAVR